MPKSKNKILVTGGAGFVGTNLIKFVPNLIKSNSNLIKFDRNCKKKDSMSG